ALEPLLGIELDVLQVQRVKRDVLLEALVEVLDYLLERRLVRAARDESHLLHRVDDAARIAHQRALDQLDDAGAHVARDLGDRPEVEEDDRRWACWWTLTVGARPDEQVSGVRVGVIDPIGEDLLAVDLDDLARELAAIEPERLRARLVDDLATR